MQNILFILYRLLVCIFVSLKLTGRMVHMLFPKNIQILFEVFIIILFLVMQEFSLAAKEINLTAAKYIFNGDIKASSLTTCILDMPE